MGRMRTLPATCGVALLLLLSGIRPAPLLAQASPSGVEITTRSPQTGIVGEGLVVNLVARGGSAPYSWRLLTGQLPPGLRLLPRRRAIVGVPTAPGQYAVTVGVTDSGVPAQQVQTSLTFSIIAGLTIDWKQPPEVRGNAIAGSAVVRNQTGEGFDLTVVVVAVNEIGRATTLGYQHFTLPPQTESPIIPFSAAPGAGSYVVHADAVAHHAEGDYIFRARKQTEKALKIIQP